MTQQGDRQKQAQKALKVVHLSTTDNGGAGKAAHRLHKGLQASGVDSTMLVVNRKNLDPSIRTIPSGRLGGMLRCPEEHPPNLAYAGRVWQQWNAQVCRYPQRSQYIEVFSDDYSELELNLVREIREADIINLHWMPGMLNYVIAPSAFEGKKVVWTMHDMNPFTGGCHYSGDCSAYLKSCGSCPMLGSREEDDLSRAIWLAKDAAYRGIDLNPVAPSRWLARAASQSGLLSRFETRVIPNGFPVEVFAPFPQRDEVREGYGVPKGARVVLFGAESVVNERKGFVYLLEAMRRLSDDRIVFACFGNMPEEVRLSLNLPLLNLGFVEDEGTLAALYSMADLFVIPSIEDNLPNTVVEAMLCGVPVAGFDIGGIPDMVEHKRTGYLIPPRDVKALAEGINWCLFHPDAAGMGARAREKALTSYSMQVQAANYTALYRELLAAGEAAPCLGTDRQQPGVSSLAAEATPSPCGGKKGGSTALPRPAESPVISLVIPSYNYGQYLEACLDSILSQNYPNIELLVLDGGSTDNTVQILKRYQRHIAFWRSGRDGGNYSAIEEGLNRSSGEIMTWLNADDMLHPKALDLVARIFAKPEVEWLMGRPNSFDEGGRQKHVCSYLPMNSRAKYLADEELIQQEGVFWRRGLWERSGRYIDKSLLLAADLELWARFFRSARLFSINTLIAGFRDHPLQKSKDKAGYTAEANLVLARERQIFAAEKTPYNPPAPLPVLIDGDEVIF